MAVSDHVSVTFDGSRACGASPDFRGRRITVATVTTDQVRRRVIEQLRRLPDGCEIEWGDDASGDQPLLTGALLIWAPAIARPLHLHWLWVVTGAEPEAGMSAMSIVVDPDAEGCWTPAQISQALTDWAAVHAGRLDLTLTYQPRLISDLALRIAAH